MIYFAEGFPCFVIFTGFVACLFIFSVLAKGTRGERSETPRSGERPVRGGGRRPSERAWSCRNQDCLSKNPAHARYCRMCGRPRRRRGPGP